MRDKTNKFVSVEPFINFYEILKNFQKCIQFWQSEFNLQLIEKPIYMYFQKIAESQRLPQFPRFFNNKKTNSLAMFA